MKSKAPLVMMEQIVMVLIFALAAALCLQTFVLSGKISKETELGNEAVIEAQNAAERMKAEGAGISSYETETGLYVEICPVTRENGFVWETEIVVYGPNGDELFRIPVAGQTEVMPYE